MADSDAWRLLRAYVTPVTPETPPAATDDPAAEAGEADDGGAAPTPPPSSATPDEPETPPTPAETLRARIAGVRNVGAALDAALPVGLVQGAARVPTPGGLFPLFVALFFFLFAIVPVHPSGATRLNLIWRALTGGASLPPSPQRQSFDSLAGAAALGGIGEVVRHDSNFLWDGFWGATGGAILHDAGQSVLHNVEQSILGG